MDFRSVRARSALIVGSLALVIGGVIVGTASANAGHGPAAHETHTSANIPVHTPGKSRFRKNDRGDTYGSDLGVPFADQPDLIAAFATNGQSGYVKRRDLEEPMPRTPEEAIASNKQNAEDREIPVYAQDGVTVIGAFTITGNHGLSTAAASDNG